MFKELSQLKELTALNLCYTEITDTGLKDLGQLTNLTTLYLCGTKITDTGVKDLN